MKKKYGSKIYTPEIDEYIRAHIKGTPLRELTEMINKEFDKSFGYEQIKNYCCRKHYTNGVDFRFKAGSEAFNKGVKITEWASAESIAKMAKTQFKKGQQSINHRPLGSTRQTRDGYIEIKTKEPNGWELLHRVEWEKHNGKLGPNDVVRFLNGDKTNCNIDNLVLVSRAEHVEITRQGLMCEHVEVNKSAVVLAQLTVAGRRKHKRSVTINNGQELD